MKVRDLRALLVWLDERGIGPEENVHFDDSLGTVTVIRVRPGMPHGNDDLSEDDKQFPRSLRIRL